MLPILSGKPRHTFQILIAISYDTMPLPKLAISASLAATSLTQSIITIEASAAPYIAGSGGLPTPPTTETSVKVSNDGTFGRVSTQGWGRFLVEGTFGSCHGMFRTLVICLILELVILQ